MNGSIGNVSGPVKLKKVWFVGATAGAPEAANVEEKAVRKRPATAVRENVLCMDLCCCFRVGKMAVTQPFG